MDTILVVSGAVIVILVFPIVAAVVAIGQKRCYYGGTL